MVSLRVKSQKISLRLEKKIVICDKNEWLRLSTAYTKDVRFDDIGMAIGNRRIKGE